MKRNSGLKPLRPEISSLINKVQQEIKKPRPAMEGAFLLQDTFYLNEVTCFKLIALPIA
jgi:hypothetical protein